MGLWWCGTCQEIWHQLFAQFVGLSTSARVKIFAMMAADPLQLDAYLFLGECAKVNLDCWSTSGHLNSARVLLILPIQPKFFWPLWVAEMHSSYLGYRSAFSLSNEPECLWFLWCVSACPLFLEGTEVRSRFFVWCRSMLVFFREWVSTFGPSLESAEVRLGFFRVGGISWSFFSVYSYDLLKERKKISWITTWNPQRISES